MKKEDGSLHLHGKTTPLIDVFLRRRSVRAYDDGKPPKEAIDYVMRTAFAFMKRNMFSAPRLMLIDDEKDFLGLVACAMKGILGKGNPWLSVTKARVMLLCGAVYDEKSQPKQIERAIKEAAMTMQVAILSATEVGIASCWIAAINHEEIERHYPLPDNARLIAMSPLGFARSQKGISWDTIANFLVSSRRKGLDELWMRERWRED